MSIANGLILATKDKRLNITASYIKTTVDNLSVYKMNIAPRTWLFIFSDYSALLFNTATENIIVYTESNCDLLKWVRENNAD